MTEETEREVAGRAGFMIGELYFLKKDYAAAITHFFTVAYAYGYPVWQADAHFEAARCFELLGKTDQARQSYRAVVDEFPTSDKREAAERRLAALEAEENRAAAADQP